MKKIVIVTCLLSTLLIGNVEAVAQQEFDRNVKIGERPALEQHMDQSNIEERKIRFKDLLAHGKAVFDARFNELDGQGRPASTGGGAFRDKHGQPAFIRTSGPDSNSCSGCHNQPSSGGAGDNVANVFVLAQLLDPVIESVSPEFSNERNTLGMFGSGAIESLAREMSEELFQIREDAVNEALMSQQFVTKDLVAKGVSFGSITVTPEGLIDPSNIDGVDWDLIIKPFHQKGAVVSLREFTNNAMNHHHGIQTVERFGLYTDPDDDGVVNELSVGDVTAATVFQATLPVPNRKLPSHPKRRAAARFGEKVFDEVGCTGCHKPAMVLKSRYFVEPNPLNPDGNLKTADVSTSIAWDMTRQGQKGPKLERFGSGAIVRAYTDLKRHNLCDADLQHFCNERLHQGSLVGFADPSDFTVSPDPRPTEEFLTRKLWDVANSDPFGHKGDLTTLTKAIYYHGGDAREVRDSFFALQQNDQDSVIEFLKTLGVFSEEHSGNRWPPHRLEKENSMSNFSDDILRNFGKNGELSGNNIALMED